VRRKTGERSTSRFGASVLVALSMVLAALPQAAGAEANRCGGRTATIVGTPGDDTLVGTAGADVIAGGGGNDTISGRGGADVICGGRGDDLLIGGGGDDTLDGQAGDDRLVGDSGSDRLMGGTGDDVLEGGQGADSLAGAAGADALYGGTGNDALSGGPGSDVVTGGPGDDHLAGGSGDDILAGGRGSDVCAGDDGHDDASECESVATTETGQLPPPRTRPSHRAIALTFDDGPHPLFTPPILDILDRYDVKATFFVLGWQAHRYPELIEEIVARGHSVQNHTWYHRNLRASSSAVVAAELRRAQEEVLEIAGLTPRCYRPPYGASSARVRDIAAGQGLAEVMWDVSGADWTRPSVASIVRRVLTADGGDIVLLHDAGGMRWNTVAALPAIIRGFQKRKLSFETLCD